MDKPYNEIILNEYLSIRYFKADTDQLELDWHRDYENRWICALKETDWLFQFDNQLPMPFDDCFFVPKGLYHRLVKGKGDLEIMVMKKGD